MEKIQGLSPEEAGKVLMEQQDIAKVHEEVAEEGQTKVCLDISHEVYRLLLTANIFKSSFSIPFKKKTQKNSLLYGIVNHLGEKMRFS